MAAAVRVKSQLGKEELSGLIAACIQEAEKAGVYMTDLAEPLSKQLIKLYCKANYGYDESSEKFRAAYAALRDSMSLSGDYQKDGDADDG